MSLSAMATLAQQRPILATIGAASFLGILVFTLFPRGTSLPAPVFLPNTRIPIQVPLPTHEAAFIRDPTPIHTVQGFLSLAESEVAARNAETCDSQLGWEMILAYESTKLDFCTSEDAANGAHAVCFPVRNSPRTKWWPYPQSFCVSRNLEATSGMGDFRGSCKVTAEGTKLLHDMGGESFLGTHLQETDRAARAAGPFRNNHTMVFIRRQDQWNPFHVAEDLVTTVLALLIAGRAFPNLVHERVQLAFGDDFQIERNHFASLWDHVGAWPPRRLSMDRFEDGTSFSNVIHSVGAGASLLSATGVGKDYSCASSIVWASSHYYRYLLGMPPVDPHGRAPVNVLWLSRDKFNAYLTAHGQLKSWQKERLIANEHDLLARFKTGLAALCASSDCEYQDAEENPQWWASPTGPSGKRALRFLSIDPSVHILETQIELVGHATILTGLHGGALGLSLFLPPGQAAIYELHTTNTVANKHFHNMAAMMGHKYDKRLIKTTVDIESVWGGLKGLVEGMLRA